MKRISSCLSLLVLVGSLAGTAMAADDGILLKEELAPGSNYCHMKFPAMWPSTLDTEHPTLTNEPSNSGRDGSGDIIDFYGPCDESPTGPDQVWQQKLDAEHRFSQDYED